MASSDDEPVRLNKRRLAKVLEEDDEPIQEQNQSSQKEQAEIAERIVPELENQTKENNGESLDNSKRWQSEATSMSNRHLDDNKSVMSIDHDTNGVVQLVQPIDVIPAQAPLRQSLLSLIMPISMEELMLDYPVTIQQPVQAPLKRVEQQSYRKKITNDIMDAAAAQQKNQTIFKPKVVPLKSKMPSSQGKRESNQSQPVKMTPSKRPKIESSVDEVSGSGSGSSDGFSSSESSSSLSKSNNSEDSAKKRKMKELTKEKMQLLNNLKAKSKMSVNEKVQYLDRQAIKQDKNDRIKQIKEQKQAFRKDVPKKEKIVHKHSAEKKKMQVAAVAEEELNLNRQEHIVEEFAKRWWYGLPPVWPPVDYDYSKSLAEHNLRRIEPSKFKTEVDVDGKGLKKVQEVECYPGIFKDTDGKAYDLRPLDSCPSLNNFTRMDKKALQKLLFRAYENQLKALEETQQPYDKEFESSLKLQLRKKLTKLKQFV